MATKKKATTKRKKGGPPSKLNPSTHETIVNAIRAGAYIETAAAMADVGRSTLHAWLRRGANETSGPYREFHRDVSKAAAASEVHDVALIGKAAESVWQAAAWRLERKHPERWGRRQVIQVGTSDDLLKSAEIELANLSDQELAALEMLLSKGTKKGDPEPVK